MMTYRHKDWQTFKGTWYIVCRKNFDLFTLIMNNPKQYGLIEDWEQIK